MNATTWTVTRRRSSATAFHSRSVPDPATPEVWVHEIDRPALVLGSTQRDDGIVDADTAHRAEVEIVRRRSGGGAVMLVPDEVVWVDVIIPAGHVAWSHDVHRPMVWLGHRLAEAFAAVGVSDAGVHDAALVTSPFSRLVCFDGLGPGELTLAGAKLVGISQRRTRGAARLQCCWYSSYDPSLLTSLLVDAPRPSELAPVATVERHVSLSVVDALVDALRAASHRRRR